MQRDENDIPAGDKSAGATRIPRRRREPKGEPALVDAGIHRIVLPPPGKAGGLMANANAYIIDDDPLTLIDTGWRTPAGMSQLENALARLGRRVRDIELIVITHQHIDHFGLAAEIVRLSGASVAALDLLVPLLADFDGQYSRDEPLIEAFLLRNGASPEVIAAIVASNATRRALSDNLVVTRPLKPGSELELRGRTLSVLHRPGHSPSDTVFYDARRRLLLAGDHLIRDIAPVPTIARRLDGDDGSDWRFRALPTFLNSLRATQAMEIDVVLSGHGDAIRSHAKLIDDRARFHEHQAEVVFALLRERPLTVFEIALRMWGQTAVSLPHLAFAKVLGWTDVLEAVGRVKQRADDALVRFEALAA